MNGFIEVTCTRKNGSTYKRLITLSEIVEVIEDYNHAFISYVAAKNGRAIYGISVTESFEEIRNKIAAKIPRKSPAGEVPA